MALPWIPILIGGGALYWLFGPQRAPGPVTPPQLPPDTTPRQPASYPNWDAAWSQQSNGALAPAGTRLFISGEGVNVRESPNTSAAILRQLSRATPVVADPNDPAVATGWWLVTTPLGVQGYVSTQFLDATAPSTGAVRARRERMMNQYDVMGQQFDIIGQQQFDIIGQRGGRGDRGGAVRTVRGGADGGVRTIRGGGGSGMPIRRDGGSVRVIRGGDGRRDGFRNFRGFRDRFVNYDVVNYPWWGYSYGWPYGWPQASSYQSPSLRQAYVAWQSAAASNAQTGVPNAQIVEQLRQRFEQILYSGQTQAYRPQGYGYGYPGYGWPYSYGAPGILAY